MLIKNKYNQLFVEFEKYNVHIDIHLSHFNKKNVYPILKNYIKKYKDKEIEQLSVKFWDKSVAGDYLSLLRKNASETYLTKPLTGIKYINAVYNYLNTSSEIGNVSIIN